MIIYSTYFVLSTKIEEQVLDLPFTQTAQNEQQQKKNEKDHKTLDSDPRKRENK
jgi:hypothetical protein